MVERKTIVLLHGGPGFDHTHFKPDFQVLSSTAQLVLMDQRGHGRSHVSAPQFWNIDQGADDVAAFCAALAIEKPVLLGDSFGGFVALAAALRHPDLPSSIITLGSAARVEREAVVARFGDLGGPMAARAAGDFFARSDDDSAANEFRSACFPLYARKGMVMENLTRGIYRRHPSVHFFKPGEEFGRFDLREALRSCRVPTLMLHGKQDPIVPVEFAQATAASFPAWAVRLVAFDDCAHDVARDRSEAELREIATFVRGPG